MISKTQIKLIQSLKHAQSRKEHQLYVVEGVKLVDEVLNSQHEVLAVYATKDWQNKKNLSSLLHLIEDWELAKISNLTTPNKVLALVKIPYTGAVPDTGSELVLLLDHISDPGNMGTIIRTAEWFGIDRVIASPDSVDFWNPKVVQASMGSVFRMKLNVTELPHYLSSVSNTPVFGTLFDGEELTGAELTPYGIIVIGNESHGISPEVRRFITRKLTIRAALSSASESLNASIASAIVCYEFRKQFPR